MKELNQITPYHLDVLKEIGNIGAGHAATALSELLNKTIDMRVPDVALMSFNDLLEKVGGPDEVLASVFLRVEGDAPGSMFFMLSLDQATSFIKKMIGDESFSFQEPPYPEMAISALQELGNILAGSYLTSLAEFTKLSFHPSVPALGIDMAGALISLGLIELGRAGDNAILIDTTFFEHDLPNDNYIQGHFFLLPDPESFQIIFEALGVRENE